jgi:hypothetical protein
LSPIQQAYLRVGASRSSFGRSPPAIGAIQPGARTTWVAGVGTNWAFAVTQIFLDATRTVDPNATGYTVKRDQLRFRITRDFSAKLSGILGARVFVDNATESTPPFTERKYGIATLGFKWRWLRAWTLSGEYDYTRQKFANDPSAAMANAATLSVIYEPIAQDVYHPTAPIH